MVEGHRAVDLARLAGVSAQQIRNYADAGILPAVPRTGSGHRRFGAEHRRALLAYRALAAGCGPRTAQAIMHAVNDGDLPAALALLDGAHAALHERRRSLAATEEALDAVDDVPAPRGVMRVGEVAAHLGIRTSALRTWEAAGLLTPDRERGTGYRRYAPSHVREARMIRMLRQGHYPLPLIREILDDLRRTGGRAALKEAVKGQRETVTRQAAAMLAAAARLQEYLGG